MDCSSITDFQQSTAIRIAKKFRNLHIGNLVQLCATSGCDFQQQVGWEPANFFLAIHHLSSKQFIFT